MLAGAGCLTWERRRDMSQPGSAGRGPKAV